MRPLYLNKYIQFMKSQNHINMQLKKTKNYFLNFVVSNPKYKYKKPTCKRKIRVVQVHSCELPDDLNTSKVLRKCSLYLIVEIMLLYQKNLHKKYLKNWLATMKV